MKTLFISGLVTVVLGIGVACTQSSGEESIRIHGHVGEQLYEVTVSAEQVEALLQEEGYFYCEGDLCHISPEPLEHDEHDDSLRRVA